MYINQLIVGIQLCYTVTSIRELFLLASSLFSFSRFFFLLSISINFSSFFFFPDVSLLYLENSAGRALKNSRSNRRRPVLIPFSLPLPFSSRINYSVTYVTHVEEQRRSVGT